MDVDDHLPVASKMQRRPADRIVALGGATAIALTILLILSPSDARHLLEALLRLFHMPVPAENSPAPDDAPPKAIEVTLVPKPSLSKAVPSPGKSGLPPAGGPAARPTGAQLGAEPAAAGPAESAATASPQAAAPQRPTTPLASAAAMPGIVGTSVEDAPMSETPGKSSSEGGSTSGLKVPALKLALTATDIAQLLATGAAVVVATSGEAKAAYVLGTDHRFTVATASQLASISPRSFSVASADLVGPWSNTLKRDDPGASFEFALHFSNAAEAIIIGEQLDAVKAKGIDLGKEMAAGHVVVTDGAIDPDTLNFHIVGVSER